jgi:hypothetical protein
MRIVMAQLSRPFQIGLLAVAVLAAAWLVLLRPHASNSTPPVPASPPTSAVRTVKASTAPKHAKGSGSSSIYHGSAPGVQGLTRAIAKANGAVATSQQNAKQLEEKSTQASAAAPTATTSAPSAASTPTTPTAVVPAAKAPTTSTSSAAAGHGAAGHGTSVARQHAVEAQLAKGRTVVILFWDAKGADDQSVHSAVRSLRSQHSLNIDTQEASAGQVASFGSITRGLQIYGTPTLLIVDKQGRAKTLTGLQDAYAISQAIRELQHSS